MVLTWVPLCMLIIEKKDILILGKCTTQGLDDTTMTAEKKYSTHFTGQHKKFCLSLLYNWVNSYIFVNGVKICKLKAKNSEINAASLCLVNVSNDFSVEKM